MYELKIYYQNVNGLRSKLNEFYLNNLIHNFDCIALTETWLHEGIYCAELFGSSYIAYRKDRNFSVTNKRDGGGVLLAVKSVYKSERCFMLESAEVESVWVKVYLTSNSYLFICVVYFPPNTSKDTYKSFFTKVEECEQLLSDSLVLLIGDFNLRSLSTHWIRREPLILPPLETYVLQKLQYFNMTQFNNIRNINEYYLDLVLLNSPLCEVYESEANLVPADRHHPCLEIKVKLYNFKASPVQNKEIYNFARADCVSLYQKLSNIDWGMLYSISKLDDAVEYFYDIIFSIINDCVPKYKPRKRSWPVWFNQQIVSKVRLKEKLHRKYKKSCLGRDYIAFSRVRTELKIDIRTAYVSYNQYKENQISNDPKQFWNFIKTKKCNLDTNRILLHEENILFNPLEQCEAFANYFQSIYSPQSPHINLSLIQNIPISEDLDILSINQITKDEVILAFKRLKPKKSKGRDGLPQYFMKCFSEPLLEPLLFIFNLSLKQSEFPTVGKEAIVCPIPKIPMTNYINQHRPISLLCAPCKIFESILYARIFNHIKSMISDDQYGFQPKRSVVTNLVNFTEEVLQVFEKGSQLDVVYTDFRKAFDLVQFDVLLMKMRTCGFSSSLIKFFHSYLCGRYQYIYYNGQQSLKFPVHSSVPQGSNLGPLLFLIMINDLPKEIHHSKCFLFADDLKICKEVTSIRDQFSLQEDLNRVQEWCRNNKLYFNVEKCITTTYSLKKETIQTSYKIDSRELNRHSLVKDLGVWFDNKLTFEVHISKKVNEAFRLFGFIKRNSYYFQNQETVINLFNTFIRPKLEYCSVIWNPYHANKKYQIEKVQKKFIKYLARRFLQLDPRLLSYVPLLNSFNIFTLEKRRSVIDLLYLYRILNGLENNSAVLSKLNFNVNKHRRSMNLFYNNYNRLEITKNSPINRICQLMNQFSILDPFSPDSLTVFRTLCYSILN